MYLSDEPARALFMADLFDALAKEGASVSPSVQLYVTNLLVSVAHGDRVIRFDEPMALEMLDAIDVERKEVRRIRMQHVGDAALLLCGWWWQHVESSRHGPKRSYYAHLGRSAYRLVAVDHRFEGLADELSAKFTVLSDTLARMAASTGSFDDRDAYRMYTLWLERGSERARRILDQHGIVVDAELH